METISTTPLARTLSRAEGFLAGLIYIDSMPPIIAQDFNTNPISFQNAERWTFLQHVHYQLEETRHRLLNATHRMDLKCTDSTLNSFVNPTLFYEAAVSGFHNILLGLPPTTLGETIALCVMSHVTSCCLYSTCNYIGLHPFSNFDLWRNAISNHDHRQTFDDLINAVCLEPCLDFLMDISQYDNDMSNGALDLFWNSDLPTINESMQLTTSTEAPDLPSLQGSPIVANLTHFLERCGELPLILSSRGATANNWHPIGISKPARSEAEHRIQRLYIQLLQDNGCFKDPIARGILSVVDRFIGLGYLHNTCEMRDYLLLVGKGMLPSDKLFLDFIQSVRDAMIEAVNRIASSKKVPCDVCGKLFTRKTNMRRHIERRH